MEAKGFLSLFQLAFQLLYPGSQALILRVEVGVLLRVDVDWAIELAAT